jgi:hypothetical protein
MAADAVITALVLTLQNEVNAGAALPADIIALSAGLVSEAVAYRDSVYGRRVGILAPGVNVSIFDGDSSMNKMALCFNECINADASVRSNISADSDLGQLRNGLPGISTARVNAIATATIARATTFQTMFGQTLPA